MPELREIGVVAALEREMRPLIRGYKRVERSHERRTFIFYEGDGLAAVCGGIGVEAARRASEALVALYQPRLIVSAGFAGALDDSLHIGDVFCPALLIDASDGSRMEAGGNTGALVTFAALARAQQKAKLAKAYQAQAVDMEAATVARAARRHGITFCVVKAVSDEAGFEVPGLERFVVPGEGSGLRLLSFVTYVLLRPWLWGKAIHLGMGSRKAARSLCRHLRAIARGSKDQSIPASVDFAVRTKC